MAEMFDKPLVTRQTMCYCTFVVKSKIMEKPNKYKFNEYGKFIYKWRSGKTVTLRVPEALKDQILAYARQLDTESVAQ